MFVDLHGHGARQLVHMEFGYTNIHPVPPNGQEFFAQRENYLFVENATSESFREDAVKTMSKFKFDLKSKPPITYQRIDLGTGDPFKIESEFNPKFYHVEFAHTFGDMNGDGRDDLLFIPKGGLNSQYLFPAKTLRNGKRTESQQKIVDASPDIRPNLYIMLNQTRNGKIQFKRPQQLRANIWAESIAVKDLDNDGSNEIVLLRGGEVSILSTSKRSRFRFQRD